jgi:pyruvate-ferredoxin/flavodoxin oxidoreductase
VYVAEIAMGSNENQTIKALQEAESYDGPSLIIAYSQCIAHGIDMTKGMNQQALAVDSGYWPLFRFDPRSDIPLQIDSKDPTLALEDYFYRENRYRILTKSNPDAAQKYLELAKKSIKSRLRSLKRLASAEDDEVDAGALTQRPKLPPVGRPRPRPGSRPGQTPPARLPKKDN